MPLRHRSSTDHGYMTGEALYIDGGYHIIDW